MEDRRLLATWTVDDDFSGVACDTSQRKCETIQEAVDAARPGDTIKVNAGVYNENVDVGKKLTIQGVGLPTVDPVDTSGVGLSDGATAYGFFLHANDIVIKGFHIANGDDGENDNLDDTTDADNTGGIGTSNAFSGYKIQNNVIERNTFGIYLNTSTSSSAHFTEVTGNTIRDNDQPGAISGDGIYSDQGARKIRITSNKFIRQGTPNDGNDIIFTNAVPGARPLQIGITITKNTFQSGAIGVHFAGVQLSEISNNDMRGENFNGIQLSGGNVGIMIKNNTMKDVGTQGYNGIRALDNGPAFIGVPLGANARLTIQGNTIINAGLSGIRLSDTTNSIVRGNTVVGSLGLDLSVEGWGNGISLEAGPYTGLGATNNIIDGNTLKLNARHGLYVDAASTGNLIKNNVSVENAVFTPRDPGDPDSGGFDYRDQSTGDGTAGTGNRYQNNAGRTDNPNGLIKRHI